MTTLEDQISALLKAAPGDPPLTLHAEDLLDTRDRWRGRLLTPGGKPASRPSESALIAPRVSPGLESSREEKAIGQVTDTLNDASLPAGAKPGPRKIHIDLSESYVYGQQTWTAPGSVAGILDHAYAHPPAGFTEKDAGANSVYLRNHASTRSLQYDARSFGAGTVRVSVRAGAQWDPVRPFWAYAAGTLSSVDATVIRKGVPGESAGAPTVRRTLAGSAAQRLATLFDSLSAVREENASCPAPLVERLDVVIFHSARGVVTVRAGDNCLGQATITAPGRSRVVFVEGGRLETALLRALGLPSNYGEAVH
jgi:hypothetical protein